MNITKEYIDLDGSVYFFKDIEKMQRTKDNAFLHGLSVFCRSWTFERLTASEKLNCIDSFLWAKRQNMLKGAFSDRISIMNAIYYAFLRGIGYSGNVEWRQEA